MKYFLLILVLTCACNQKRNPYEVRLNNSINKTDIAFYTNTKIVFVQPDSTKMDSLKRSFSIEEFYKSIDVNNYYSIKFKKYLNTKGLHFESSTRRYVCFISLHNDTFLFDTKKVELNWFIIIFDGVNFPTYISNISVPED